MVTSYGETSGFAAVSANELPLVNGGSKSGFTVDYDGITIKDGPWTVNVGPNANGSVTGSATYSIK